MRTGIGRWFIGVCLFLLCACQDTQLNNPYPEEDKAINAIYTVFTEQPKTLDPARSYSHNEAIFTAQIYEPPLQYHYLLRPYTLIPLTATAVPVPQYLDAKNQLVSGENPEEVAFAVYTICIKPGIMYQPHPALAKSAAGDFLYHDKMDYTPFQRLSDFPQQGTRELIAEDYVYQIKRLAHPAVQSPILGLMSEHILGLSDYAKTLQQAQQASLVAGNTPYLDLRNYPLAGAKVLSRYCYQITLQDQYPQFIYWLAMPFFAPMPWEADAFYSQPGLQKNNISLDWYPIGTGPYMLTENDPNSRMVLSRNPNFTHETYPAAGMPEDESAGLLRNANQALPLVDHYIFKLERESIPVWNKFLQGYYDQSGISSDSFDQAIQIDETGEAVLTKEMAEKELRLKTSIEPGVFFMGFNMLDDVVGGTSERARKLRLAIAIALNFEEYISIFSNGRGVPAQGPIPPGIFGHQAGQAGINPYVYDWKNEKAQRKSLSEAQRLLAEAGYPGGVDEVTGEPLILNYDTIGGQGADERSRFDWIRKQFDKLGIQLHIRSTQYNRFQDKVRTGNIQIFDWGWLADYPDPENFLFLLYGPNGRVAYGGENTTNYQNDQYDALFQQMKILPNGPERMAVIQQMLEIIRHDSPVAWQFHRKNFVLQHQWIGPGKNLDVGNNALKYRTIDSAQRQRLRAQWNRPVFWPLGVLVIIFIAGLIPVVIRYWQKERKPPEKVE